MVTFREKPELVAGGELRQANDALGVEPGEVEVQGELNHGEAFDGFLMDSSGGGGEAVTVVIGDDETGAFQSASDDGVEG